MTHGLVLASGEGFHAPSPIEFQLPPIYDGAPAVLTKSSLLLVLAAIIVFVFMFATSRRGALVPTKLQYVGESAYNFVRNGIAKDIIGGHDFLKFVPLLVSLFFFLLVNNLYGLIPFLQFSPFSRVSFAYALAALVWVIYNGIGMWRHGPLKYIKNQTVPSGVPIVILPLLIPLEFLSNIIVRPITLSLRLFANMFAGHLLLILFSTGASYLLFDATKNGISQVAGVLSFVLGFLVGFLEFIVAILQAYVFTLLTATYVSTSLAAEH